MRKVFVGGVATSTAAIVAIWIAFGIGGPGGSGICHSVTQYGITWSFARGLPCGQYANSDWWIAPAPGDATAQITSITPSFSGTRNGAMVNPTGTFDPAQEHQGYDDRLDHFSAGVNPTLPYSAHPGDSIIKTVSTSFDCGLFGAGIYQHLPCLDTAAVLTVVSGAADRRGQFRPPYAGTLKPVFTVAQLQTGTLPSLTPPTGVSIAPLSQWARRYQRVQIDQLSSFAGRYTHATLNFSVHDSMSEFNTGTGAPRLENQGISSYGGAIAQDAADAALRLELNDSLSAKMPALINYVQYGLDVYGLKNAGVQWSGAFGNGGGHDQGRKIAVVFAATLLNDATMKADIAADAADPNGQPDGGGYYGSEDTDTYMSTTTGGGNLVLWGRAGNDCTEDTYNSVMTADPHVGSVGPVDCRDPYEYIDGGINTTTKGFYEQCCTAGPWKGEALAVMLLPGATTVWAHPPFFRFANRWVNSGFHMLPDVPSKPAAAPWTPPRYPELDNTSVDSGGAYQTQFMNRMWSTYRSTVTVP